MDNVEINRLLKQHMQTRNNFFGVFPYDSVPVLEVSADKPSFIIINQDPAHKDGSHWIALEIDISQTKKPKRKGMYFDSYGHAPPKHMKKHVMRILGKKYAHNKQALQGFLATTCGQWCMLYILERCRGTTHTSFLKSFSKKDLDTNDILANAMVEKEFQTDQDVIDTSFILENSDCKKQQCKDRQHNEHIAALISDVIPLFSKKVKAKGKKGMLKRVTRKKHTG